MYDFGLIDTTSIPVGTKSGRDRLLAALQDAIARFEPRLAQRALAHRCAAASRSPLRFVVEAVLVMDPGREDVVFDTVLEVASGEYDVRELTDRRRPPERAAMRDDLLLYYGAS